MPWRGGDRLPSLGWGVLDWAWKVLPSPDDETKPFVCTDEQVELLIAWFTIDPKTGKYVYRRGCSRRSKGWGKSPLEALKALAEFAGPTVFAGWDASGDPIGVRRGTRGDAPPWVQIAAVSEDQTENTYGTLYSLLTANEGKAASELGIDEGRTRLYLKGRPGRLEPVTASAGSREGQRVTYAVLDESHLWTHRNGGIRLARTLRRNVAKMGGRSYETTNSFIPGEGSVAEATYKAWEAGQAGLFYDQVEAPPVAPEDSDETLRQALAVAYGHASWIDLDRIVKEIRDQDTTWEDAKRFFFNHNTSGSGQPIDIQFWEKELAKPRDVPDGTRIGLGFDGSISDDATVLYGCTEEGYIFEIAAWERPLGVQEWRVPRLDVDRVVTETKERYEVGRMLCDPAKWWTEIETWMARWNPERAEDAIVIMLDTNQARRFAPVCDRFTVAAREKQLAHDGKPGLTAHLAACAKKPVRVGDDQEDGRSRFVIVKADTRKIDRAVGAFLAYEAAMTMPPKATAESLVPFAAWT